MIIDWLGIRACFYKHDHSSSSSTHEKIGIVIGAGGTARAAAYALGRMGCSRIRIWNRTVDKAKSLAQVFGVEVVEKLSDLLLVQQQTGFCTFYVVSTIPASAQESLSAQIEEMLLAASKSSDGILVEMAYKPRVTPLIKAVKSSTLLSSPWTVVEGIEALIEQGFEQFSRWTGMMPPKPRMRSAVLDQGQQR